MMRLSRTGSALFVVLFMYVTHVHGQPPAEGTLAAWGDPNNGQTNVPLGVYKAVSMGAFHGAAIRVDGTLAAWGYNGYGQTNVPPGTFTDIAAGYLHSVAVRQDGTLAAWGYNGSGLGNFPPGVFKAVATNYLHNVALRTDGTIAAWGNNSHGQTNVPLGVFKAVGAGAFHCVGLRVDGTLAAWGDNAHGQTNVPPGVFIAVIAGDRHNLAIRPDGTLAAWGSNTRGQINVPPGTFTSIAAGWYHSAAVRADGTLAAWGDTSYGQLNVPTGVFKAVAANGYASVAIYGLQNRPPVAVVNASNAEDADDGPNVSTFCADAAGATVSLSGTGSSDPDGDSLSYLWSIIDGPAGATIANHNQADTTGSFPPGAYTVKLTVSDGKGGTDSATVAIAVDTVPQAVLVATATGDADTGPDVLVQGTGPNGAMVVLDGSGSSDPDAGDTLEYAWSVAEGSGAVLTNTDQPVTQGAFPPGTYTVKLTVYDVRDGERRGGVDVAEVKITIVADTTPPAITSLTTDVTALWPANNKMVPVAITVQASDDDTAAGQLQLQCKVSSSQPDQTSDDPTLVGDVNGQDGFTAPVGVTLTYQDGAYRGVVHLRAERQGGVKAGRTYSINVTAIDSAGNQNSSASTVVVVPHDKRS